MKILKNTTPIYLAGHRGLVGSAVLRRLEAGGYTNVLTRTHAQLDLTRQADVEAFFAAERPEVVILAAARVGGILANSTYQAEFIYQNLQIASNVIHAAWKTGVRKLLNLGSSCIYPKLAEQPMQESALLTGPLEPTNEPYAIAKIAAIKLCRYYNEQYGTNFISAMPTNLYGPGDNFDLETSHVLPALLRKFAEAGARPDGTDDPVTVWGDGTPRREFLYVDDLAGALLYLLEHVDANRMREVSPDYFVNVGTGADVTIRELAETIAEVVGWRGEIQWDTTKPNGTPRKLMDVSTMTELGWTATTSLRQGIEKTWEWYKQYGPER
jgi:GDP-L-fucose synthase